MKTKRKILATYVTPKMKEEIELIADELSFSVSSYLKYLIVKDLDFRKSLRSEAK